MHNKLDVAYFLCALAIVFLGGFAVGDYNARTHPTLDSAQAAWEKNDSTARTLNWKGFRKGDAKSILDCSDYAGLRGCRLFLMMADPMTGSDLGWREHAFACSVETCAWVLEP